MEQTAGDAPVRTGRPALQPRHPSRPADAGRQHPAGAEDSRGARGEHVHSEPPAPGVAVPVPPLVPAPPVPGSAAVPGSAPVRGDESGHPRRSRPQPERHSVRAQVLEALREALLSGELAPGEVYSAPALAERLGVSATPVREAMQRLVCEGAVETVPNRGFRIAECSEHELAELAEIRLLLEVPSVLETARTMPPECWESLLPYAEQALAIAEAGDRAAYAEADRAFHRAMLELTGNRQLVAVAADIQRRTQRRPAPAARSLRIEALRRDAVDHVTLLDALRVRDLDTAESVLRAHVRG
jgi:DNA-binding GntR family transcriptional regulator